jgi:NAD(P)-dependent dehydrogenase (short-subunit alcohol dehydrogenase family)
LAIGYWLLAIGCWLVQQLTWIYSLYSDVYGINFTVSQCFNPLMFSNFANQKYQMNFQNKVVLITGAASGIGRTTAIEFAKLGANIVVADRQVEKGKETVELIQAADGEALFVAVDVANHTSVEKMIAQTVARFGRLDIAINNAGIGPQKTAKTHQHGLEDWDRVIAVNQTGVFYCMQAELQIMLEQGSGNIINIASVAGLKALPNNIAYTASKHAVVGMTKTAALEYARKDIRINAVCPVFTHSPMLEQLFSSKSGLREQLQHTIPLGRYGETDEIAQAILWLSSEHASFITGQAFPVDGGMMAS